MNNGIRKQVTGTIAAALLAGIAMGATARAEESSMTWTGSHATTSREFYLGGMLGISSVSQDRGSGLGYGLEGNYYFQDQVGVGAFVRGGNHDRGLSSFLFGGELVARLYPTLPGLQVGLLLGSGHFSSNVDSSDSSLAYGAKASLDIPVSSDFPLTLGLDLSAVRMSIDSSVIPNAGDSYWIVTPALTAKAWF